MYGLRRSLEGPSTPLPVGCPLGDPLPPSASARGSLDMALKRTFFGEATAAALANASNSQGCRGGQGGGACLDVAPSASPPSLCGGLPPEPEDGAGPRFALEPLPVPGSSWLPVSLGESGPGLLSLCPSSGRSFYWCIFFTGNEPFRNECRLVCIKMCQLLRNTCGWSVRPLQGLPTHGGGWQREASAFLHLRWWVPQVWLRRDPWGQGSPRHRGKHTAQSRGMVFSLVLVGGRG